MSITIRMPAFSVTMESAKLLSWSVSAGQTVEKGQVLAEVETDKSVATIESPVAGRIVDILVDAGDADVPVHSALAVLESQSGSGEPAQSSSTSARTSAESSPPKEQSEPPGRKTDQQLEPGTQRRNEPSSGRRVASSPAARALAREHGIALHEVAGSGPGGRIVKTDVLRALDEAAGGARENTGASGESRKRRLAMARALVHAKASAPHFYAEVELHLDPLLILRRGQTEKRAPTITAYLVRAAACALKDVPAANRFWSDEGVIDRSTFHVGCAVGLAERVVVPVVRDADQLTVEQAGTEIRRLAALASSGELHQRDLGDASLTISNLGMYGIDRFFPIINVPEAIIMGIGRARRVVSELEDGELGVRTIMSCTASIDHRALDGTTIGDFLQAFKKRIEVPELLSA